MNAAVIRQPSAMVHVPVVDARGGASNRNGGSGAPPNNRLQATAGGLEGAGPARRAYARRA